MTRSTLKDHPRLCGEKYQRHFQHLPRLGSPPPMRGKAFDPSLIILNKRITPAYAGKREFRRVQTLLHQDHPRLCGEKSAEIMAEHDAEGITPAYAGKRESTGTLRVTLKDHPRLCGEKCFLSLPAIKTKGSPPPMRGKVPPFIDFAVAPRITPAYAGKRLVRCTVL